MDKKFQTILLRAKEEVYSHLSGGNISKILGQGYDFSELHEYVNGDDIRHISWINSAKLGEPYVKKMHEERELHVAIISLQDGRFLVGNKRELLTYVIAVLAYSAYEANELLTFIDIEVKRDEPTKNLYTIEKNLEKIYDKKLLGERLNYEKLNSVHLASKNLLFIVGDFLESVDLSLLAQKHEVVVIILRDRREEEPIFAADEQLIDPQSNQPIHQSLSKQAIKYYKKKLKEHDIKLERHFHQCSVKYVKIYNEEEVLLKLERIFLTTL